MVDDDHDHDDDHQIYKCFNFFVSHSISQEHEKALRSAHFALRKNFDALHKNFMNFVRTSRTS